MARLNYHQKAVRNDLMVDLETLGTDDDSVILSIGALVFDPFADPGSLIDADGNCLVPSFYKVLHIDTQKNRMINPDTVKWWESPSRKEAWNEINNYPDKQHLQPVLDEFWDWIVANCKGGKAYACAPSFDVDMMSHAFRTCGIKKMKGAGNDFPIPFYEDMDVRTIENFIFGGKFRGKELARTGTYHNALDDCITQAMMIQEAGARLRGANLLCSVPAAEKQK